MKLDHPNLTLEEECWCSNFQSANADCPDAVREWLAEHVKIFGNVLMNKSSKRAEKRKLRKSQIKVTVFRKKKSNRRNRQYLKAKKGTKKYISWKKREGIIKMKRNVEKK